MISFLHPSTLNLLLVKLKIAPYNYSITTGSSHIGQYSFANLYLSIILNLSCKASFTKREYGYDRTKRNVNLWFGTTKATCQAIGIETVHNDYYFDNDRGSCHIICNDNSRWLFCDNELLGIGLKEHTKYEFDYVMEPAVNSKITVKDFLANVEEISLTTMICGKVMKNEKRESLFKYEDCRDGIFYNVILLQPLKFFRSEFSTELNTEIESSFSLEVGTKSRVQISLSTKSKLQCMVDGKGYQMKNHMEEG